MFSPDQWTASTGVSFYNSVATQSLRFDDGSSAYLSRTPSSAGNRQTWVISFWIKRSTISTNQGLWSTYNGTGTINTQSSFRASDNKLDFYDNDGSYQWNLVTTQAFRDTSAWYHLVYAVDTTQATASNRVKLYVNGTQITAFDTATYPSLNFSGADWNNNVIQFIGKHSSNYFDGYIAEFNNIDGLSFFSDTSGTPNTSFNINSFGETKNGVWIAKEYTGSYGTNGFRLQFNQTGTGTPSSSTIGADTSGNNNHFTSSGIVASDCDMPDSPENNFATALGALAEPQDYQSYYKGTYSEGNLKVTGSSSGWSNGSSNFGMTSGKWYAECRINAKAGTGYIRFGVRSRPARTYDEYFWNDDGTGQVDGTTSPYSARVGTYTAGDILMVALDLENNAIYFGKNGTWENSATSSEISAGTTTNAFVVSTTIVPTEDDNSGHAYFFYCQPHSTGSNITWNFGQDSSFAGLETAQGNSDSGDGITDFYYTPPTGFLGNTTVNLPEPTISPNADTQADDYFTPIAYAGNTTDNHLVPASGDTPDSISFAPDWIWIKNRDTTHTHILVDSVRGVNAGYLTTQNTNQESGNNSLVKTIETSSPFGFTLGTAGAVNGAYDLVAWVWKAGGTAVLNEQGSINSNVSANTDAGFSIVTYSANNTAGATVGHGVQVNGVATAPKMVIIKKRNVAERWFVWHTGDSTEYMYLNETFAGQANLDDRFGNNTTVTLPSSTVLTLGTSNDVNGASGTYVAYCFAEVEGFSKFGSYTGNGSADGTFVYTGFRPAFVMFKNADTVNSWIMQDAVRDSYNVATKALVANDIYSEATVSARNIDFLSNGFKLRTTAVDTNGTQTFVYMAFAETPFRYANAR